MTKLELQIAFSFYFIKISNPPSSYAYLDPPPSPYLILPNVPTPPVPRPPTSPAYRTPRLFRTQKHISKITLVKNLISPL